jgi:CheY-like chemotaxis protein
MSSEKIMIVEDEAAVARDIRDCLEGIGYVVTSMVGSGEEAIELAGEEHPDAVLMDIHLRGERDGIDTAGEIHSRFNIPVVFLTAHADKEVLERAEKVGSFGYLIKPFEERELHATIKMALHKAKADAAILAASRMEATATLAAGISHDYNNLMQVVLGNAEFVRSDLGDGHPDAEILREIEAAARRASDLAQRLLAFARGGAYLMENVDLNRIITQALRAQERIVPQGIQVTCDLDGRLQSVKADRTQLGMLLTSLCANAVEAIAEYGEIRIATKNTNIDDALAEEHAGLKPGRYAVLSVEDTGSGMNEEILAKAFEPFFSTKFQGRGLGLAAVYGIVKNHGGCIAMESKENEGTTCTIYFPAVEAAVKKPANPPTAAAAKGTGTILVVEDEEVLLRMTSEMLTRLGYQVLTADNGRSALTRVREHDGEIHLVLLDMGMPVMDGPTAFPLLKKERPEMKVLLFSGYELDSVAQGLLDAGASGFLMKPVTSNTLAAEIRSALSD